jgi:hypothetical protein
MVAQSLMVRSAASSPLVPAKAGTQSRPARSQDLDSRLRGNERLKSVPSPMQPNAPLSVFFAAPGMPYSLHLPLGQSRGDGAPSSASLPYPHLPVRAPVCDGCAPLGAPSRFFCPRVRASWFPSGFISRPWRQFGSSPCRASDRPKPLERLSCPASSSQSGRSAARSGPGASRARGYEPRPQAPHPNPAIRTSHDNARARSEADRAAGAL